MVLRQGQKLVPACQGRSKLRKVKGRCLRGLVKRVTGEESIAIRKRVVHPHLPIVFRGRLGTYESVLARPNIGKRIQRKDRCDLRRNRYRGEGDIAGQAASVMTAPAAP